MLHRHKRQPPPPFTSSAARSAQRLSVRARRARDGELRQELADLMPWLSRKLRHVAVQAIPIRQVEALRLRALDEAKP